MIEGMVTGASCSLQARNWRNLSRLRQAAINGLVEGAEALIDRFQEMPRPL